MPVIVGRIITKKPHELLPQIAIEGLPRPVVPNTLIRPKHGKDIGTEGLPLFEQTTDEERAKEQAKQEYLI